MALEAELLELLRPLVERTVREALERERRWRWASVRQAAELLDLTPNAIYVRIHRGRLPSVLLDGKRYVDLEALERQMEALP